MEVGLAFGSVGDIIQLCQLAIKLKRAIGAGCHGIGESAEEYQELREELDNLVRILMQVSSSCDNINYLYELIQGLGRRHVRTIRIIRLLGRTRRSCKKCG